MARTIGSSGAKTLEAIRREGLRLIAEHGYEGMSLRDLAAAVGLRQGSLYNHIETKQALLFGLVAEHMEKLLVELDQALAGVTGAAPRLEAFVAFHVRYHMVRRSEVFVVNSELRSLEPGNYAAIVAMRRAYERRLSEILADGMAEGVFAPSDPQVTAFAILALATGVVAWYRPEGRLSEEEIVATHVRLAMAGVGLSIGRTSTEQSSRQPRIGTRQQIAGTERAAAAEGTQGPSSVSSSRRRPGSIVQ